MAKGKKPKPPANTAHIAKRINQCLEWIDAGYGCQRAVREGTVMWGVKTRQVEEYWSRAMKIVVAQFEKERPQLVASISKKLDSIYDQCMQGYNVGVDDRGDVITRPDMTNARQSLMDKAKLVGLLKNQLEVSGQIKTGLEGLTDDEFDDTFTSADS